MFENPQFNDYTLFDSVILNNITSIEPFNIELFSKTILDSLNKPYDINNDKYYDAVNISFMNKYLKYKNKYLQLKKELLI